MAATAPEQTSPGSTGAEPPDDAPPVVHAPPTGTPPLMAQRTYQCLRLGAIGVIFILGISLAREYVVAGDCLNRSISAYYYTSVQTVFVGTLIALGLVMIVLWGKTATEDGLFNLAGLLAPVVAFVPTGDRPYHCGVTTAQGNKADAQVSSAVKASLPAVDNNMFAYLSIIGVVLVGMVVVGFVAHRRNWALVTANPVAYWLPLGAAVVLWGFLAVKMKTDKGWIYAHAHKYSAILMFVMIVLAVFEIARQKWRGIADSAEAPSLPWARGYLGLAVLMSVGAVLIGLLVPHLPKAWSDHTVFILEAWMIVLLAVFWGLQTWDRWGDGAPPVTDEEVAQAQAAAADSS
jgi:hypothetical protein